MTTREQEIYESVRHLKYLKREIKEHYHLTGRELAGITASYVTEEMIQPAITLLITMLGELSYIEMSKGKHLENEPKIKEQPDK